MPSKKTRPLTAARRFKNLRLAAIPLLLIISWLVLASSQQAVDSTAANFTAASVKPAIQVAKPKLVSFRVEKIIDAQTLLISTANRQEYCVVFNGVNTPLRQQSGYKRSLLGLVELVQGYLNNSVTLEVDAALNSKVWLASIYDSEKDIFGNLVLIRFGLAWPDTYRSQNEKLNSSFHQQARAALNDAKEERRGHWASWHLDEPVRTPPQSYIDLLEKQGHLDAACQP